MTKGEIKKGQSVLGYPKRQPSRVPCQKRGQAQKPHCIRIRSREERRVFRGGAWVDRARHTHKDRAESQVGLPFSLATPNFAAFFL